MNVKKDPREIAEALMSRSVCAVQVGACLVDKYGVFAWGWNHAGADGYGAHAEAHCLGRANHLRVAGSKIYVAAQRMKNGRPVTAKPCHNCHCIIRGLGVWQVWYRDGDGEWQRL